MNTLVRLLCAVAGRFCRGGGRRRRQHRGLATLVGAIGLVALWVFPSLAEEASTDRSAGQLLVASRQMTDPNFAKTIIYIVAHDRQGAFGLVVNRRLGGGSLQDLLAASNLPAPPSAAAVRLYSGGPVQPQRGFVLHSADYAGESTIGLNDWLAFSPGRDVFEAIAAGGGPQQVLVILGYAGWAPGQLDNEIARGDWLLAPASAALIFTDDPDAAWDRAIKLAGIPL